MGGGSRTKRCFLVNQRGVILSQGPLTCESRVGGGSYPNRILSRPQHRPAVCRGHGVLGGVEQGRPSA